jgi:hypothetical protein
MVPFDVELEFENKPLTITAEQLDRLADEDGFIRFDITTGERRSVIYVNMEEELPQPVTRQNPETHFEAVHYPEHLPAFSLDDVFTLDEVRIIGKAISDHDRGLQSNKSIFSS